MRVRIDPLAFRHLRLSVAEAAELLHVSPRTVRNWQAGRSRVPYAAFRLLRLRRGFDLPGKAWAGWELTPEALRLNGWFGR